MVVHASWQMYLEPCPPQLHHCATSIPVSIVLVELEVAQQHNWERHGTEHISCIWHVKDELHVHGNRSDLDIDIIPYFD